MKALNITHKNIISIIIFISILFIGNKINNYNTELILSKNDKYFELGCISTKINNNLYSKPLTTNIEKNRDYYLEQQHTHKSIVPTKQELINDFDFIKYEITILNSKLENIIYYKILFLFILLIFTFILIFKNLK